MRWNSQIVTPVSLVVVRDRVSPSMAYVLIPHILSIARGSTRIEFSEKRVDKVLFKDRIILCGDSVRVRYIAGESRGPLG